MTLLPISKDDARACQIGQEVDRILNAGGIGLNIRRCWPDGYKAESIMSPADVVSGEICHGSYDRLDDLLAAFVSCREKVESRYADGVNRDNKGWQP